MKYKILNYCSLYPSDIYNRTQRNPFDSLDIIKRRFALKICNIYNIKQPYETRSQYEHTLRLSRAMID